MSVIPVSLTQEEFLLIQQSLLDSGCHWGMHASELRSEAMKDGSKLRDAQEIEQQAAAAFQLRDRLAAI